MSDRRQPNTRRFAASPTAAPINVTPMIPPPETAVAAAPLAAAAALTERLETTAPPVRQISSGPESLFATYQKTLASFGESQRSMAADVTALTLAMNGLAHSSFTAATENLTALMGARNFADAVEIQLGFTRRGLETLVEGSTKIGEIGARLVGSAVKPAVTPFAG